MGKIMQAIGRVFSGGAKAFSRFPASMISAIVIAVSASILVQLDYSANDRIFRHLQLAAVPGVFLGMALTVLVLGRIYRPILFYLANLIALLASGGVYYLLQLQTGDIPEILTARIIAVSAIAFLGFLIVISKDPGRSDYNQAAFMVLKSALIAMIYALVILLGLYFVAFAVQSLLYKELSEKVYQHIAVWSGLAWFAFFLGYFPSFRQDQTDDHLETAQKHPTFIEILFAYVMIPIVFALTAVLLIWSIRILAVREWPEFSQLSSIFSAYALVGIFLSLMVSRYVQPIALLFRKIFPIATLLFLAFEAYAIVSQVRSTGIKINIYFISLIWIYALLTSILLITMPVVRNRLSAFLAAVLILAAVLPVINYQALPVAAQVSRLRQVLNKNDMLLDNKIQMAPTSISNEDKIVITDATNFLSRYADAVKAAWFNDSISKTTNFMTIYGFNETYPSGENTHYQEQYTYLFLPAGFTDISAYQYVAARSEGSGGQVFNIKGQKGTWRFELANNGFNSKPRLLVTLDGKDFLEQDLSVWLNNLNQKYKGLTGKESVGVDYADMQLKLEQNGATILVIFSSIDISATSQGTNYGININSIFLKEN